MYYFFSTLLSFIGFDKAILGLRSIIACLHKRIVLPTTHIEYSNNNSHTKFWSYCTASPLPNQGLYKQR